MIFYGRIVCQLSQITGPSKYYLFAHSCKPTIYKRGDCTYQKIPLPSTFVFIDREENLFASYDCHQLSIDSYQPRPPQPSTCGVANQTTDCGDTQSTNNTFLRTEDPEYPNAIYIQAPNGLYVLPENRNVGESFFKEGPSLSYISSKSALRMGNFDDWSVNQPLGELSTALGQNGHAKELTDFSSGIGNTSHSQSITQSVLLDLGATGIGGAHAMGMHNQALNSAALASGYANLASGVASQALGAYTHAEGVASHAEGSRTLASGEAAHAEGVLTVASGRASHAEGYLTAAEKDGAHAEGIGSTAKGLASHATGWFNTANADLSVVEGQFNTANHLGVHLMGYGCTSTSSFNAFRYAPSPSDVPNNLSNASHSLQIGSSMVNAVIDFFGNYFGVSYNTRNADYAEMFEWKDGNPQKEDRVGYFVELVDGQYIQIQKNNQPVLGVVSHTAGILGDSGNLSWGKMYLTDDFGRPLIDTDYYQAYVKRLSLKYPGKLYPSSSTSMTKEEALIALGELSEDDLTLLDNLQPETRPRNNPEYRKQEEYIPRSSRNEWEPIGLLGKVYVRDSGQCLVGEWCSAEDGLAVPGNKWRVLQRISPKVIRILITPESK